MKRGMIKVSVFYPGGEDITFDMEYYSKKHVRMVRDLLGDAVKGISVEKGISGGAPGSDPFYTAVAHLYFENIGMFEESFTPHARKIMADVNNFTNSRPVMQIGEVVV